MNQRRGQFVSSQQLTPGKGVAGAPLLPANSASYNVNRQPFFRLNLIRSLQLHRKMAVGFTLAGLALAAAYVAIKWPVYTAQSQIYIQPLSLWMIENGWPPHWPNDSQTYDSYIAQQIQSASRTDVQLSALHRLPLGVWQRSGENEQEAAARLGQSVEVERIGTSFEIGITAHARDAEAAAEVANAMAASIIEKAWREEKAGNRERVAILHEEQLRIEKELDADRAEQASLNAAAAAGSATPRMQRANDLATDIVRLQTRRSSVDERMQNLILEDRVPGAAHLSTAAEAPRSPAVMGIAKKVLPMVLGGLLLGLLATQIANHLDQRIYIADDIKHVVGIAPMAQLPDFDQVSEGVAEEHLLRLSAAIEHAYQRSNLRSFIFTSAGPGAGVTTVVGRVSSLLESMGRPTVLVGAGWVPPASSRGGSNVHDLNGEASAQLASRHGSRSMALPHHLAEEAESGGESVVLTDTAPLGISAETEYLARFVDAAIVLVESGVTTRSQLREVSATMQRLDVPAVGFVLNHIGLEKADHSFRQSIELTERYLRHQNRSFKQDLDEIKRQRKRDIASHAAAATSQFGNQPRPETHVFHLLEWKAANPTGDVEAAKAEATRQGYDVVER